MAQQTKAGAELAAASRRPSGTQSGVAAPSEQGGSTPPTTTPSRAADDAVEPGSGGRA